MSPEERARTVVLKWDAEAQEMPEPSFVEFETWIVNSITDAIAAAERAAYERAATLVRGELSHDLGSELAADILSLIDERSP